jgi:hypothetical protein
MSSFFGGILNITLAIILVSSVLIYQVKNTNTTGWTAGEVALWGTISLAAAAGVVYGVMQVFGMG